MLRNAGACPGKSGQQFMTLCSGSRRIQKEVAIMKINKHAIARIMLCLMLTFAMVAPMAMPSEVYAAKNTKSSSSVVKSKTQQISGMKMVFKGKVMTNERLNFAPGNLTVTGKKKSIKLTWGSVPNPKKITGYYILRRDGNGTWRHIASVKKNTRSYTDKKANKKNKFYMYAVVAYKRYSGEYKVSNATDWAGAVTTRSKTKNVSSVKVTNLANVVSIMSGSCAQTYLKYPNKAYSKEIRWSSSNNSVATVDANGLVRGISPGSATIYAKTHTGNVTAFTTRITKPGSAQAMIDTFSAWMGYSRINGNQNGIIDIYNSVTPWPAGYKMKYSDAWCDATITAAAIKTGNVERIGRECSVPRHIKIFQALGIWQEDGTITPRPGDIIVYSWSKFKQPNNASASHIGLVVSVQNGRITAIEGNRGIGIVATREIPVGWGCIRGYAQPKYVN